MGTTTSTITRDSLIHWHCHRCGKRWTTKEVGDTCLSCRHRRCRWKCRSVKVEVEAEKVTRRRKRLKKRCRVVVAVC
jgi:hypothetical protein